jgi:hypothetical protein
MSRKAYPFDNVKTADAAMGQIATELSELQKSSLAQGGRGVALRQQGQLTALNSPIILGQTPGQGTGCTAYLKTSFDAAYTNAQVDFMVLSFGKSVIFQSFVITNALLAAQDSLEFTAYGCAADFWQVQITLKNGATPASMLQSSLVNFGVENPLSTASGITALTGDVTASGSGSIAATVVSATGSGGVFTVTAGIVDWAPVGTSLSVLSAGISAAASGATPLAQNIQIPNGCAADVTLICKAFNGTDSAVQTFHGNVQRVGGVLTVTGAFTGNAIAASAGASTWSFAITESGSNVVVTFTGSAGAGTTQVGITAQLDTVT